MFDIKWLDLKVTPIILLTSSALLSTNQFFGEPIQCDLPAGGVGQLNLNNLSKSSRYPYQVSGETLRSYCWMYSSFSLPASFQVKSLMFSKHPSSTLFLRVAKLGVSIFPYPVCASNPILDRKCISKSCFDVSFI